MKKVDGFSLLTISICCCIFVALGYVKLFNGVAQRVNRADTAEYWQLRAAALNFRDPAGEARLAFVEGNLEKLHFDKMIDVNDQKVAKRAMQQQRAEPRTIQPTAASFGGLDWLIPKAGQGSLKDSYNDFVQAATQFKLAYNLELNRLQDQQ